MQTSKTYTTPLLIAIEGPDGAGKTTQAAILGGESLHFPVYMTPTGARIKRMLHDPEHCDAVTLQSLMLTNRFEALSHIHDTLRRGHDLILDRYTASGIAYGVADGLNKQWLIDIHETLPIPDINFLLDIPISESFLRRPERECAYEANRDRLESAAKEYREIWARKNSAPVGYTQRSWRNTQSDWIVIDGLQSPTVITALMQQHIDRRRQSVQGRK